MNRSVLTCLGPLGKTAALMATTSLLLACAGSDALPPVPEPLPATIPAPVPIATIPGTSIPIAVGTDPNAAFSFVSATASASTETDEPIELAEAALATSETDEPTAPA